MFNINKQTQLVAGVVQISPTFPRWNSVPEVLPTVGVLVSQMLTVRGMPYAVLMGAPTHAKVLEELLQEDILDANILTFKCYHFRFLRYNIYIFYKL